MTEIDNASEAYESMQSSNTALVRQLGERDARISQMTGEQLRHEQGMARCRDDKAMAESCSRLAQQHRQGLEQRLQELQLASQVCLPPPPKWIMHARLIVRLAPSGCVSALRRVKVSYLPKNIFFVLEGSDCAQQADVCLNRQTGMAAHTLMLCICAQALQPCLLPIWCCQLAWSQLA